MIGEWVAQAGPIGLAVLVVFVPGLLIGSGLGLRGLRLWSAAPGVSVALLSVLAILLPVAGIRWGLLPVGIATAVVAGLVWLVAALVRRGGRAAAPTAPSPSPSPSPSLPSSRRGTLLLVCGLAIGAVLNAARLMTYVGRPEAISQTNDAVFHLNALRWIAESGSASSFDLTGFLGGSGFYPGAWHAVASLAEMDPSAAPVAANAVALVIAALIWPLGIAALVRSVLGGSGSRAAAFAAALSGGLLVFPQLMFEWGVLYPYALSLSLVPAAIALTIDALNGWSRSWRSAIGPGLAALSGVAAIGIAQPSSVLLWGIFVLVWATVSLASSPAIRRKAWRWALLVAGWAVLAVLWAIFTWLTGPVTWRSYRSPLGAGADVLLNAHSQVPMALGMSVLMLIGIVVALRAPQWRWLVLMWALLSIAYVVAVATDLPFVKRALTGPWYGDSFRLAAVVPLAVVPLAALGLAWVVGRAERILTSPAVRRAIPAVALVGIAAVGAVWIAAMPVVQLRIAAETDPQSRYAINDRSYLSSDEYALIRRLPETTPADAVILGNPSTGSSFAYLLADRNMVVRTWSPPMTEAWEVIASRLRDAGTDPAVCAALAAYGSPGYVLDFGPGKEGPGLYVMKGMTDFEDRPGFEQVDHEGDASLWRITACR
ncbi:hypothetical protein J2Y69_000894 [Microbacterium resistens]|uniref:4-amino-4-deoxy-L-arabinose transferase n=1 Tax=Microbacterium resistens TaxID=156977 RepID=A0ABU1SBN8_9MICO|nr:DUF6541 family protein [Microbacterium resistens]MDR6866302.1 hypothetical protein [Microbacterium resistens]